MHTAKDGETLEEILLSGVFVAGKDLYLPPEDPRVPAADPALIHPTGDLLPGALLYFQDTPCLPQCRGPLTLITLCPRR